MGKTSGERKARSPELARKAALARWEQARSPELARKAALARRKAEHDKEGQPQSPNEELAQEKHRRKFVQPLKKKPVERKKKES
jgi:hypothetical protein